MKKEDLKIEKVKCQGPGGQHINKSETGCKITHIPTGVSVKICGRSYPNNEKKALKKLQARIKKAEREERAEEQKKIRDHKIKNTKTIRTYNYKRRTVKDHRSGKTANLDRFMEGEIDAFDFSTYE